MSAPSTLRRASITLLALGSTLPSACGDVQSDLITGSEPESPMAGGPSGGGSTNGGSTNAGASSGGTAGATGATPECTTNAECTTGERRFCHPETHRCVECVSNAYCEVGEECSDVLGECAIPCTTSQSCPANDDPTCDPVLGYCVECLENTDCENGALCRQWECTG